MEFYKKYFDQTLDQIKSDGRYRYFLQIDKASKTFPIFKYKDQQDKVKEAVNWCTNDYLGMGSNDEVIKTFKDVLSHSGTGSGGTRNIAGTTNFHAALEEKIAQLHKKESALLFNGAFLANYSTLASLGKIIPNLTYVSDELNHASIIEGIKSARCDKEIFAHNDVVDLEAKLSKLDINKPKVIVFESVYSMSGSIAPVQKIIGLAKKYNALTYVDEVHAVGLYGPGKAGVLEANGLEKEIDIINGTLAKSFGVLGGYIAAKKEIVESIRLKGAGFIFTTSLPPALCAAATKSIEIVTTDEEIHRDLFSNVNLLRQTLKHHQISYIESKSHITPVIIGNSTICKKISDTLLNEHGIYIQPINYPTVKKGTERLRITITPKHSKEQIIHLAKALSKTLQKFDLLTADSDALSFVATSEDFEGIKINP